MSGLDDGVFVKLRDMVYERTGLYFDQRKKYFFSRRVVQRMEAVGATSPFDYYQTIRYDGGADELEQLAEALTTNETYFFREYPQLKAFAEDILPEVLERKRRKGHRFLRLWSAGCSTGEESYTLAIILREMIEDLSRWEIHLTASDLNREALLYAKRAVYSERSVKDVPSPYLSKYFWPFNGAWKVDPCITAMVRFQHANLLDLSFAQSLQGLDFVFCRNVLIYFDDSSRRRVVDSFYDALRPGGYIFLGHSESVSRVTSAFRLVRRGDILAYVK
jgi:chemotaxis protein methyltransferase CheR